MRFAFLLLGLVLAPAAASAGAGATSYAVLREDATDTSRVVSVRIEDRLAEADLSALTASISAASPNPANKHTVVLFYLPGMSPDQRPWASADTTPSLKISIAGLSLAEVSAHGAAAAADSRALVGAWLTDLPATPGRISLVSENGATWLEWVRRAGETTREEVKLSKADRGNQRVEFVGGGDDHYVIRSTSELEIRSGDRLIAVAKPIDRKVAPNTAKSLTWVTTIAAMPSDSPAPAEAALAMAASEPPLPAAQAVPAPAARPFLAAGRRRLARPARKLKPNPYVVTSDYMRPITR